jgi:hypothetical protein
VPARSKPTEGGLPDAGEEGRDWQGEPQAANDALSSPHLAADGTLSRIACCYGLFKET